jgi:hypothetical protein
MKQRRSKGRKARKRQPTPTDTDPPPVPSPSSWQVVGGQVPIRRKVHPNLMPQLIEPPLPMREAADQASFKGEGEGRVLADATLVATLVRAPHEEMLSRIAILESLMAELPKQPVGIGHNQQLITQDDVQEIKQAIAILKAQPAVPTAPDQARAAGSTLKNIGERLGTYLDAFMLEAAKSGGKELGKRLVQFPYWYILVDALMRLAQSVTTWLH